jgi:restriction endonuclease S subunit
MIEELKAYKQSVITEAVTKGLNPNAKLVPSGIDWIGEIPEGWRACRIKNVASLYKGT